MKRFSVTRWWAILLKEFVQLRRDRITFGMIVGLPIGLFFYSMWANHDYVSMLWTRTLGLFMLGAGIIAIGLGILWMRKIVKIEV